MSRHSEAIRRAHALGYRVGDGVMRSPAGRELKAQINPRRPYPRVSFRLGESNRKIDVHRFVAFQVFGDAALQPGVEARHLNGDSTDCRPCNIAIGTASDNAFDKSPEVRKRMALAAASKRRRLSAEQARRIVALRAAGVPGSVIASEFAVSQSTVSEILSGKLYSEATGIEQRSRVPTERDGLGFNAARGAA